MSNRTYYCVEEMPSYPINTIFVQTRPFASSGGRVHKVRASSKHEAEEKVWRILMDEREPLIKEIAEQE